MSKSQKYFSIRLKIPDKSVDLFVLNGILCKVRTYTIPFLFVARHKPGTRKAILWSVTVYNKYVFGQCNLTAHINPV